MQPSSTIAPLRATSGAGSTGGESQGSGTGVRQQQSPLEDHRYHRDETVPAAVVAAWGHRLPKVSARIVEDDGGITPAGRDVEQSGTFDITARSPSFSESRKGAFSGPSKQHGFSSGLARQHDAASGSGRVPVGGIVSEKCLPQAAVTAPASPAAAGVTSTQTSAGAMVRGATDEVVRPGTLLLSLLTHNKEGRAVRIV